MARQGVAVHGEGWDRTLTAARRSPRCRSEPPPSDRLQPVYALAKKACQQFGKAARCHATVVKLSLPSGGVVVGSPQERPWKQASRCSQVAADKGLELLEQAEAKGVEIQVENG